MFVNASNNAVAKLSSNINSSQTSLTVDDASIFPDAPFLITVNDEIMRVTSVSGNSLTVQRGREGTSASSHNAGSTVENNFTAGTYQALVDEINKSIRVVDSEIGDDYILKKYSDGTFELKGNFSETVNLDTQITGHYRTNNLTYEFTQISGSEYKVINLIAHLTSGASNTMLANSAFSDGIQNKTLEYRIIRPSTGETSIDIVISYEVFGTWS